MAALRPFYFDPLSDWTKGKKKLETGEEGNEKAVEILKNVEDKLNGLVKSKKKEEEERKRKSKSSSSVNLPLSVEGQVQFLINEATSQDNLSQMFVGWTPFL